MKYANYIGCFAALLVIYSCTLVWVSIEDLKIIVTGFSSKGTSFGMPGLMNTIMSVAAFLLFLVPRIWAKRANLFFTGFNLAWAVRNFILVTTCHGGDCPQKHAGIFLLLVASILMLVMSLVPDIKLTDTAVD
jgi:hypothetical protein